MGKWANIITANTDQGAFLVVFFFFAISHLKSLKDDAEHLETLKVKCTSLTFLLNLTKLLSVRHQINTPDKHV